MITEGIVHKYGDNVDTDAILPARYIIFSDLVDLAKHCMEDIDEDFAKAVCPGDVIVAGENFGCGSSREHAPISIKAAGVACVIAKSFARIFYRNAINIGLPIIESNEIAEKLENGDQLLVDLKAGVIKVSGTGETYKTMRFPGFIQDIIESNGLVNYTKTNKGMERKK